MIDMKMTAEEAKEQSTSCDVERNPYPYGLRINLDDDALKKLGITTLPAVGSKLNFSAVAEVCSTSAYQDNGGEAETSISLQITGMEVTSAGKSSDDAATLLYPD
jgi:hypothetical protein